MNPLANGILESSDDLDGQLLKAAHFVTFTTSAIAPMVDIGRFAG
jgi:hypothetical protein